MKKRGFTLIELMIVLAVIAILAVVIIPKSSIFKKNAKTAGVTTNMNTVRAYLETKTGDNKLDAGELLKAMDKNFDDDEAIKNPVNSSYTDIVDESGYKANAGSADAKSTQKSVIITDGKPTGTFDKGTVIVYVGKYKIGTNGPEPSRLSSAKTGYIVYGVDLDGNLLGSKYAIEK